MILIILAVVLIGIAFIVPEPVSIVLAFAAIISCVVGLLVVGEVIPWFRRKVRR